VKKTLKALVLLHKYAYLLGSGYAGGRRWVGAYTVWKSERICTLLNRITALAIMWLHT